MSIGKEYVRLAPSGYTSEFFITNQRELEYHQALAKEGFVYQEKVIHSQEECLACQA